MQPLGVSEPEKLAPGLPVTVMSAVPLLAEPGQEAALREAVVRFSREVAFAAATQSGDLKALTQLLASDVRIVTDGGGRVRAALDVIEGADRAARFLIEVSRKRPGAWWRQEFRTRFANVNGLPGIIVDAPDGPVQTAAFEIEDDVIRALYIVRNPDKLRHLVRARHESGPE